MAALWTTTTTSTYDADNHLTSFHPVIVTTTTNADTGVVRTLTTDHGTTTVGWGPNGHPVSVQNLWMSVDVPAPPMTLHWDGDALLYITNASGTVINFKVGLDGDVNPTDSAFAGLVAYDRDRSGTVIQCNNTAGNSGFINPADASPNGISCPTQAGGFTAPVMTYLPYVRSDGFAGLPVQINGVRAYDPKLGNWTTPDAYEGDVHDPASQQRYMWNRNNPYDYSDPSGYGPIDDFERGFEQWYQRVMHPGGAPGEQSGGLSDRNIESVAKDQDGTLKGFDHAQKLRDSLQGALNRLNSAAKAGAHDLAGRLADTYNDAIARLKASGANVEKALTGPKGGNGPVVRYPEEVSPQEVPHQTRN